MKTNKLKSYTLSYTNECQNDIETEFEAENFEQAIQMAKWASRGNEGLWFNITLCGEHDEYYEITF